MEKQLSVAVLGCGNRGLGAYAPLVEQQNGKIVAGAETDSKRLARFAEMYGVPPERCFSSAEDLLKHPKMADVAFICTMDEQHCDHAIKAMEQGYDILLEKPISNTLQGCMAIRETAHRLGRQVAVCHVLRYTPFYTTIKELVDGGAIGSLVSMQQFENICWWHFAHSFVRGNWRNSKETSPMILQKCCHDMDILLWLSGGNCLSVSSFGGLTYFKKENAPAGAGERCLECGIRDKCLYNAAAFYLDNEQAGFKQGNTGWPLSSLTTDIREESLMEALRTGPYGRCVYHCDNNVSDHQIVNCVFDNGVTASFTACAFTADMTREIKLMGTEGQIVGNMEKSTVTITRFNEAPQVLDLAAGGTDLSGHGGGEVRMIWDLFDALRHSQKTLRTSVDKSVQSHIMAFAAERSRREQGRVVPLSELEEEA